MKTKILKIKTCFGCPHCRQDFNITRWECWAQHRRMICWDSESTAEDGIPAWCPLEDEPTNPHPEE